jgi:hypothetical protein
MLGGPVVFPQSLDTNRKMILLLSAHVVLSHSLETQTNELFIAWWSTCFLLVMSVLTMKCLLND